MANVKILAWDSEYSPAVSYTWGNRPKYLSNDFLIEPSRMLCWGARWLGTKKVITMDERQGRTQMLEGIRDLLSEADMAITYNGASYDTKKLNGELMSEHIAPPAPYKEIDLFRVYRQNATMYSGKLDYVAERVIGKRKEETGGFALWRGVMENDPKAWRTMLKYQKTDVDLLVDLFDELRPWIKMPHPISDNPNSCHNCGGTHITLQGTARTLYSTYQRLQCQDCKKWLRGTTRYTATELRSA